MPALAVDSRNEEHFETGKHRENFQNNSSFAKLLNGFSKPYSKFAFKAKAAGI